MHTQTVIYIPLVVQDGFLGVYKQHVSHLQSLVSDNCKWSVTASFTITILIATFTYPKMKCYSQLLNASLVVPIFLSFYDVDRSLKVTLWNGTTR